MVVSERSDEQWGASRARRDSTFVQPDEFLRLLLSRQEMVRSDDRDGKVRGLLDRQTGRRFLIEQEKLLQR